jgi:hypothetical protein
MTRSSWPALAYLALAALLTWPQITRMESGVSPGTDSLLHAWVLAWNAHALLTNPLGIWSPPVFYPYADALAFSDNHLALSLVAAPLIWAGAGPVLAYNILVLLSYALAGLAVYHLVDDLLRERPRDLLDELLAPGERSVGPSMAAFVAGAAFAFCAYRMAHYFHLQLLQTAWLCWALLFMRRLLRPDGGRVRDAVLLGLFAALQCVTALYYLPFTALALGLFAGLWAGDALWRRTRDGAPLPWRRAGLLLLGAGVAAALVVPLTLPYARVYRTLGIVRTPSELENWSAPLQAYLAVDENNLLYGAVGGIFAARGGENALGPGLAVLALAALAVGLWLAERRGTLTRAASSRGPQARRLARRPPPFGETGFWLLLGLVALVLSLGTGARWERGDAPLPIPMPYDLLYRLVPGLGALRVPARWGMLVSLAACVLAGIALARLLAAPPRPLRRFGSLRGANSWALAAGGLALAVVLAERVSLPVPLVERPDVAGVPAVYGWLAAPEQRDIGVVLELPVGKTPRGAELDRIARRQFFQTAHWKALPISYSGAIPFGTTELMARAQRLPDEETLRFFRMAGVDTLVIHHAEYEPAALRDLLAAFEVAPLLRLRAELEGATVYTLQPASEPAGPERPGASIYISADERMPGAPVAGLIRSWQQEGGRLHGSGRARYYPPLAPPALGQVFDYGLLAADEDPRAHGFERAGLRWTAGGLAFYAGDPRLRARLPLGQPVPGRFHPQHPTELEIRVEPRALHLGETTVGWDAPVSRPWLELDVASASAQTIRAGDRAFTIQPGLTTLWLATPVGQSLRLSGETGATAFLRARLREGPPGREDGIAVAAAAPAAVAPAQGVAVAATPEFVGSSLRVELIAAGAEELLVEVRGAAAADERPIRLLDGTQPIVPSGGAVSFEVDLLRPEGAWLTHAGTPEDGRYIVYLKRRGGEGAVGMPIAKFNIRGGALTDAEPVPLPLTAVP